MALLDTLLPDLAAITPGALDSARMRALQRGAREYFTRSESWRIVLTGETAPDGVYDATTALMQATAAEDSPEVELFKLERVGVDGVDIDVATSRTEVYFDLKNGTRNFAEIKSSTEVQIYPPRTYTFDALAVLIPTFSITAIPDREFQLAWRGILAAATYIMLSMPQQTWSDPSGAQAAQAELFFYADRERLRADGYGQKRVRVVQYGGL